MMAFLLYDLRVAMLIAVFYVCYRLLLSRESLYELNRFLLLGTAIASFLLPLCVITVHHTELMASTPLPQITATASRTATVEATPWWHVALIVVFWTGFVISIAYTTLSISKVCLMIRRCEKHRMADGTVIAVADGEVSPFSWMHYIVMSRSDYAHPDNAILMHEHEHIRRHHSWDVVLVNILSALQWFNPAMWMLCSDLQTVHEYEADAAVLSGGVDARQYQLMLVRKAMAAAGYSVVNSINHSTLKQRITMMNTHNSKKHVWLRAFYVIPIAAASLVASARTVTDYKVAESASQIAPQAAATVKQLIAETKPMISANAKSEGKKVVSLKTDDKSKANNPLIIIDGKQCTYNALEQLSPNDILNITVLKDPEAIKKYGEKGNNGVIVINTKNGNGTVKATAKASDKVFIDTEKMPVFPGGPSELKRYISSNLQYPDVARRWKTQGRIIVSFVVSADGSVSDPQIVANHTSAGTVSNADAAEDGGKADWAKEELRRKGVQEAQAALAQEAIRVVGTMPKWEPATQDGKPVSVKYNIPVTFRIQ